MNIIFWKSFKLGELFERSTKLAISMNQKDLNLLEDKDENHTIALISASRNGSGRVGYVDDSIVEKNKVSINKITFDDQWGFTFFQKERFVITGGHNAILEVVNNKLKNILDNNLYAYSFMSLLINKITIKSEIFGYGYKINNKFDREIILLPCIEVNKDDEYIWEENGKYFTLAVEYIKSLMEQAKAYREQKTIKLYEAERAKYEAERAKYEEGYKREKSALVWKGYQLDFLFKTSTEHYLEKSKKNYDISNIKDDMHPIAVCAASKNNNGIVGYISEVDDVPSKKRKGYITKGGFGHFFYQDDWFIKPGGSYGMLDILRVINNQFRNILDNNKYCYLWLAKILTKIFAHMSSYSYSVPFGREIILLPCIEVNKEDEYIWEENGKYYTLAVEYISYLYLTGKINYNQKLIENYSYQY